LLPKDPGKRLLCLVREVCLVRVLIIALMVAENPLMVAKNPLMVAENPLMVAENPR